MKVLGDVTAELPPNGREISDASTRACVQRFTSKRVSSNCFSRTRFQCFLSDPPLSSFKKLIVLNPRLVQVQSLRTMSVAKAVPKGIKDRECKRFALREPPLVPYMPEKDSVQETVSALKSDQSLKTTIGVDAELRLPIWHCGMCEAFLMHLSSALDTIKKQGTFMAYKQAHEAYVEQKEVASKQRQLRPFSRLPLARARKFLRRLLRRSLQRNSPRRRRLPRRPRKAQLWPMHQPQNFAASTRPSMTRPLLQKRPPRPSANPLLPRYFSSTQTCCLRMPSTSGTR